MDTIQINDIPILVDEAAKYIQLNGICDFDSDFMDCISARYAGYEVFFCYHNTVPPEQFLDAAGAALVDDCIEMRLTGVSTPAAAIAHGVTPLDEASIDEFCALHDSRCPDMYWTGSRIRADMSRWGIFVIKDHNRITGYIMMAIWNPVEAEIFHVEAANTIQGSALIISAVEYAFSISRREVLFMVDKDSVQQQMALSAGFCVTGYYQGFAVKV